MLKSNPVTIINIFFQNLFQKQKIGPFSNICQESKKNHKE